MLIFKKGLCAFNKKIHNQYLIKLRTQTKKLSKI